MSRTDRPPPDPGRADSPFGAGYPADPHGVLDALRLGCPVAPVRTPAGRPVWLLTTGAAVRAGFTDPRLVMRLGGRPPAPESGHAMDVSLVNYNPPHHTAIRRLAAPVLAPSRVAEYRPLVERTAADLLDRLGAAGQVELMAEFAHPYSFGVLCGLFGLRPEVRGDLYRWMAAVFGVDGHGPANRTQAENIERLVAAEVDRRLCRPGDDALSAIVTRWDPGGPVSRAELVSLCGTLLLGGFDSTAQMIGLSLVALLAHPDQLAWLRADPARLPAAIEELLRYTTPGPSGTPRVAAEDVPVAGTVIPAGGRVILSIDAANHDPAGHPDPHRLDLGRATASRHLTFGLGAHYCPGSALARLELTVALTALLRRFPALRLAVPTTTLRWHGNHLTRGLDALPVHLVRPAPAPAAGGPG